MEKDSSLVSRVIPVSSYTEMNGKKVRYIVIHHMAGILNADATANAFKSRNSSAQYAITSDNKIIQFVPEKDRAWTTSSWDIDSQAVTIEVSNDGGANTSWHVSDANISLLIDLCTDICKRNGISKAFFKEDDPVLSDNDAGHSTLQKHCWYASTSCPGPYLGSKFTYIAAKINEKLTGNNTGTSQNTTSNPSSGNKTIEQLADEVYQGKWGTDPQRSLALTAAGYNASAVQARVNEKYYGIKHETTATVNNNKKSVDTLADEVYKGLWGVDPQRTQKLKAAGYDAAAVQARVNEKYYGIKSTTNNTTTTTKKSAEQVAKDIINLPNYGGWGTGNTRYSKLKAAGYNPQEVQNIINRLLG